MQALPAPIAAPGALLAGTAFVADGRIGALIVPGAPQGRFGAHRGFVMLARALAGAGTTTLRFDRRGTGDSDGTDPGFAHIAPDVAAARDALVAAHPALTRTIGIGLCDGAAALALDPGGFDALILLNPWTLDANEAGALPPTAAVAARYRARLASPAAWWRLLRGGVDLRKAGIGLFSLAHADAPSRTATQMARAFAAFPGPVLILLAERDNTAQAFAALWRAPLFAPVRAHGRVAVDWIPGATHTFAGDEVELARRCAAFVAQCAARWQSD